MTQDDLKRILHYNPETGDFTLLIRLGRKYSANRILNSICPKGYYRVSIREKSYKLHRLAFLYMTGRMPDGIVDHVNGNPLDNRWCNLRIVNVSQSNTNRKTQKNNKLGTKGVSFCRKKNRFKAKITVRKKTIYLGLFTNIEDACAAYDNAAKIYHGEYRRIE